MIQVLPDDLHNRALLANAHPPDWVNPKPAPRYNLVVVGAGTAGLVTAAGAAGLGAKVALIEKHLMGGDCLNVGCVPSKALIRAARACADVRDAGNFGVHVSDCRADFPAIMERMRRLRAQISPNDSAIRFRQLGVDVFLGEGRFTGSETIEVAGQTLRFKKAVIATGTRPAVPPIPGLAEAGCFTNESIFTLTELPRRLAVIGGGPIGCELAQALARFGSQVALIQSHPQILPREDDKAVQVVAQAMTRDGVKLLLDCKTKKVLVRDGEKIIEVEHQGKHEELKVDAILVAVGRSPNVDGLGLESAGVAYDRKAGVQVNDRLQTTNPRIFAAGDICSRFKFTHMADALARVVIRNALFLGREKASRLVVPWCTYTDPELAHVGLSENEAREQGIPVHVFVQELAHVDRAILDGETEGFVKVLVPKKSDRILGATIVARHAGDMIGELTLAMSAGLGMKRLFSTIHPYPTQAEAIKKTADAYSRGRLTPLVKWLLAKWLAWTG